MILHQGPQQINGGHPGRIDGMALFIVRFDQLGEYVQLLPRGPAPYDVPKAGL